MQIERPWIEHYDPGVPASIDYPAGPLSQFLEEVAVRWPDRACTVYQGQMLTYAEMNTLADRLAAALVGLGVRPGERVGLVLPNLPQFVLAFYAVMKAGGVVVAMNPQYKARELAYQAGDAGVGLVIALAGTYTLLQEVRAQTLIGRVILTRAEDAAELPGWAAGDPPESAPALPLAEGDGWLGDLIAGQPVHARPAVRVTGEDTAVFQYSGGTTGVPKGAAARHHSLVANSLMFRRWLVGLDEGRETSLMAIPLHHVYGMVVGMSVSILLGARMVLPANPRDLPELLGAIERYQVSFFPGVPTLYALVNRDPQVQAGQYNLRSVRACISGSAPLPEPVRVQFEHLTGAKLMEGYGLSEAPTATHCNPMMGEKRTGSIGLPLPDVDARIISLVDGETPLPPGEVGELVIRSPQVMVGYHNRPEATAEALRGGWLYTGDIARMDADGYFYIVDRKKALIKVSGYQVWPREIEDVIAAVPGVLEVSAAGIPDPIRGEAPKAWVVLKPGADLTAEDIIAACAEALIYYKVPVAVEFIEALPRSAVGKVLRRELVRRHLEE